MFVCVVYWSEWLLEGSRAKDIKILGGHSGDDLSEGIAMRDLNFDDEDGVF